MSAEDIDKLFKAKLGNQSVTPRPEAWEQLQARMNPAAPKEEKKPVMWYYSVAAAVTMLLGVGFWTMKDGDSLLPATGTVANVQRPSATNPPVALENETLAGNTQISATKPERVVSDDAELLVSNPAPAEPGNRKDEIAFNAKKTSETASPRPQEKSLEVSLKPDSKMVASSLVKKAESAPQELPLEIIIKLDNPTTEAIAMVTPEPEDEPAEEKGAERVLKSIFKQVKNLKDGEKVSLSELGVTNRAYALETRIGKRTFTKTIQL